MKNEKFTNQSTNSVFFSGKYNKNTEEFTFSKIKKNTKKTFQEHKVGKGKVQWKAQQKFSENNRWNFEV